MNSTMKKALYIKREFFNTDNEYCIKLSGNLFVFIPHKNLEGKTFANLASKDKFTKVSSAKILHFNTNNILKFKFTSLFARCALVVNLSKFPHTRLMLYIHVTTHSWTALLVAMVNRCVTERWKIGTNRGRKSAPILLNDRPKYMHWPRMESSLPAIPLERSLSRIWRKLHI